MRNLTSHGVSLPSARWLHAVLSRWLQLQRHSSSSSVYLYSWTDSAEPQFMTCHLLSFFFFSDVWHNFWVMLRLLQLVIRVVKFLRLFFDTRNRFDRNQHSSNGSNRFVRNHAIRVRSVRWLTFRPYTKRPVPAAFTALSHGGILNVFTSELIRRGGGNSFSLHPDERRGIHS